MTKSEIIKLAFYNKVFREVLIQKIANSDYDIFWEEVYDGGSKQVKHPDSRLRKKKPEINASTALKYPAFQEQVNQDFEKWKKENKDSVKDKKEKSKNKFELRKKLKTTPPIKEGSDYKNAPKDYVSNIVSGVSSLRKEKPHSESYRKSLQAIAPHLKWTDEDSEDFWLDIGKEAKKQGLNHKEIYPLAGHPKDKKAIRKLIEEGYNS